MPDLPITNDIKSLGLLLGCLILGPYLFFKGKEANITHGILIFLASISIIGGLHLCIIALNKLEGELEQSRAFVFLGGFAVVWNSISNVRRLFVRVG